MIKKIISAKTMDISDSMPAATPEQRFAFEFDRRFSRCVIVDDDYIKTAPTNHRQMICSHEMVNAWIENWCVLNAPPNLNFMAEVDQFIEMQFKKEREK